MSRGKISRLIGAALICGALILTAACQGAPPRQAPPAWRPKTVAVLPYRTVPPEQPGASTACSPLTGAVFACGVDQKLSSEAEAVLLDQLLTILSQRADFEVVPPAIAAPTFQRLRRQEMGKDLAQVVAETGRKVGAEAVLVGHVYRFRQLVGGAASAETPASVAFDLAMVRTSDGQVIWKNSFDETQQSLSENLLNIEQYMKTGLRWLTAQELARLGMDQLMQRFPWLKPERKKAS